MLAFWLKHLAQNTAVSGSCYKTTLLKNLSICHIFILITFHILYWQFKQWVVNPHNDNQCFPLCAQRSFGTVSFIQNGWTFGQIHQRQTIPAGNPVVNSLPIWNASNFGIHECTPVQAHAGTKIMFKLISNVFRGSTEGSLGILDISQSLPQGALVVSHFSFLLGAHYKWLMLISLSLDCTDLRYNLKC